jgi:hypothetical protein
VLAVAITASSDLELSSDLKTAIIHLPFRSNLPASDEARYRAQAKVARERASMLRDEAAASWLKIAADYDELAEGAAAAAKLGERKQGRGP